MTPRELTVVALKAVALYILVGLLLQAVGLSAAIVQWSNGERSAAAWLTGLAVTVIAIVIAVILWRTGNRLAERAQQRDDADTASAPADVMDAVMIGVGLLIAVPAGTDLFVPLYQLIVQMLNHNLHGEARGETVVWLLSLLAQTGVGAWLVLKPHGVLGLVRRWREAGLR